MDGVNPPTQPQPQPQEPVASPGFPSGGFAGFQMPPPTPPAPTASVFAPPVRSRKGVGKSVIIAGILVLMLVALVLGFDKARSFLSKAEGGCTPENISEANLTQNSVEIVFQTGKACQVEVAYGTKPGELLLQVPEAMASLNHRIRLSPLLPSTPYSYQVLVDGKKVGQEHSFTTKVAQAPTIPPTPTSGAVVVSPTPGGARTYTYDDFERYFGTANTTFDIDKNGVVNTRDWILYQKSQTK